MSLSLPTSQLPAAYGTPFEGGFYGGLVHVNGVLRALAWAPKATGTTRGPWLKKRTAALVATSCHDSLANTTAMAELGSPIAKWALDLRIAGHEDWCIPARDVLELGYRHLKPGQQDNWAGFRDGDNPSSVPPGYPYTKQSPVQTTGEAFRTGGPEAFDELWHHTSTQYDDSSAWYQSINNGYQGTSYLSAEGAVRAVRLIHVSP